MKEYLLNRDFSDRINNYGGHGIQIIKTNGYLYRSDPHFHSALGERPVFVGTKESCLDYALDMHYIKKYKTTRELKLINMSYNDKQNKVNMRNFFKNVLPMLQNGDKEKETLVKHLYVLAQLTFGFANNDDGKITFDLCGNDISTIETYLTKMSPNDKYVKFVIDSIIQQNNTSNIPTRTSFNKLDKFMAKSLKSLLSPIGVDGFIVIQDKNYEKNDNFLCRILKMNEYELCVPTELCIFDPKHMLMMIDMWQTTSKIFVNVKHKYINFKKTKKYEKKIKRVKRLIKQTKQNK
jgi:hypothetical protein